jgi:ABC-type branched-subunit amino acid transport system ATPase component
MADILLKVKDLQVGYGGIQAVKGVSLEVREGELVSLIGSNGGGQNHHHESHHRHLAFASWRHRVHG